MAGAYIAISFSRADSAIRYEGNPPPVFARRIPFGGVNASGLELPLPDMLIWIWKLAMRYSGRYRRTLARTDFTPLVGSQ